MRATFLKLLRAVILPAVAILSYASAYGGPPPCQNNADCNDGNACTADVCMTETGECRHAYTFAPHQCCDTATGMIVGFCDDDHDGCTLPQCLRTFSQGPCTPIDIEQISCMTDGQCQAYTNGVSPTCGQNNPGFCDCVCGNGVIDGAEQCDDGGETAGCDVDCTFVECGDGHVNSAAGEECEEGDVDPCGVCDDDCNFVQVPGCLCNTDLDCRTMFCKDDNACNHAVCNQQCGVCSYSCAVFGDTNTSGGTPDIDDILCTINGFSNYADCPNFDLAPCGGNGILTLDDILSVLNAFAGRNPCGCTENTAPGTGIAPLCGSTNP